MSYYISYRAVGYPTRCCVHPEAWKMTVAELRECVRYLRSCGHKSIRVLRG